MIGARTFCETADDKQTQQALRKQEAALFHHCTGDHDEKKQQLRQEIQKLKATIKQNSQFRFLTTGLICAYLYNEGLIGDDDRWKSYFTADPVIDEFTLITRHGMMNILVRMGLCHKGWITKM